MCNFVCLFQESPHLCSIINSYPINEEKNFRNLTNLTKIEEKYAQPKIKKMIWLYSCSLIRTIGLIIQQNHQK